jgi:hypothetical protein
MEYQNCQESMLALGINTYQVAGTMGNALKNWTHTYQVGLLSYTVFTFGFFQIFHFIRVYGQKVSHLIQLHPSFPSWFLKRSLLSSWCLTSTYPNHFVLGCTSYFVLTLHLQPPSLCPYSITCFHTAKPL